MVDDSQKIKIFMNTNAKMSRGKYAAHAVHAALNAAGVEYPHAVVVLGAPKAEVEKLSTIIHDAGHTELVPGTLTAGTDWRPERDVQYGVAYPSKVGGPLDKILPCESKGHALEAIDNWARGGVDTELIERDIPKWRRSNG